MDIKTVRMFLKQQTYPENNVYLTSDVLILLKNCGYYRGIKETYLSFVHTEHIEVIQFRIQYQISLSVYDL